jgi:hypothetical protein
MDGAEPVSPGQQEQALREQFEGFSARELTWLGALPTWTADLGSRLGLADGGETVTRLVGKLAAEDLIETKRALDGDGQPVEWFWLRTSVRPGLGRYLQQSGTGQLDGDLADLADAVQHLDVTSGTTGTIGSAQWLRIVLNYRTDPTGLQLMGDVEELVEAGRLGDASTLVAAARGLGELTSRTLLDAARRAQWWIDRESRIQQDRQKLRDYCPRPGIETAIKELAESASPAGSWALHLLGAGGVGKTTLIRYLASEQFPAARQVRRPFVVARVDFDHLDPSYPEQRPAELLLALAADLRGVTTTRERFHLYRLFRDAASALHEERAGQGAAGDGGPEDLRETVRNFAAFIDSLGAPVLLILDTCEELEKLYLPRSPAPAIDETFRLLEMVHQEAPGVRVLLAGRRWLVPAPGPAGAAGPLLRPRPYLRVLPVGGFTLAEADAYIDSRETRRRGQSPRPAALAPDLRQAILERSLSARRADGAEYSPFELAAYCEWAASDPALDAERLRSAPGDPLVEWRIIGRLGDDQARAALGVAAEFGRFDLALIAPALTRAGLDARAAFDGLAAQEWVNVLSVGDDGGPAVIEIDEHLVDRIRRVTANSPEWFPVDRQRLGEDAAHVIEDRPVPQVPVETVEAAVRLLPPTSAAAVWMLIEEKCRVERAWGWAAQVTARVAALEVALETARAEREGPDRPTILPAILATQAAARLHTAPGSDPAELWESVERLASRHPYPHVAPLLRLRGELGLFAAGDVSRTRALADAYRRASGPNLLTVNQIADATNWARDALAGAFVGAVHASATRGQQVSAAVQRVLNSVATIASNSPSSGAVLLLASAVQSLLRADLDAAAGLADRAVEAAVAAAGTPDTGWTDWAPPRRLADQCRLFRMIVAWRRGETLDAVPWQAWRTQALAHLDDIDSERLVAATIRFELGHHVIEPDTLGRMDSVLLDRLAPRGRPSWLHQQVEPLVVEIAEAWRVRGDPRRGVNLMRLRVEAAVAAGDDPDLIEACELALLRMCRRERTTEYTAVTRLSREGSARVRAQAWLVRTLVDGDQPRSPEEAGSWSAWWRCQDTASLASLDAAPPSPPAGPRFAAEAADRAEFALRFRGPDAVGPTPNDSGWSRDFDPESEFMLGRPLTLPPGALGRVAMSAAEVTALRFPERAIAQLVRAADNLEKAGDVRDAARATLLAGLVTARCKGRKEAEAAMSGTKGLMALSGQVGPGWLLRADAITGYLHRRPVPDGLPPSPEIMLPGTGTSRVLVTGSASPRLGDFAELTTVTAAGGGFIAWGSLATGTEAIATWAAFGAIVVLLALARGAGLLLPYRFARSRAIKVGRPATGRVSAEAVASRGARDLRGLRPATIGGALAGRWPLVTMFVPWHGTWRQHLAADPPPAFDLDGLRLPGRGGSRRLSMLEIRRADADDELLPWEQWLGAAVPAGQAPSLLWYRMSYGITWTPNRRDWRRARAAYAGPTHLTPTRRSSDLDWRPGAGPDSLRLMHLVGTPVPTGAGWRLRIADAAVVEPWMQSRRLEEGERLVSLDDVPLRRTGLLVLQAEPVDGPPQTLAGLWPGFASYARDAIDGGANAVLVVPPLPDWDAGEVAHVVWTILADSRGPLSETAVLQVAARVKSLVAAACDEGGTDHRPVCDVLLYLRGSRRARPD